MSIKAIETKYNGYRFRSRLEARWAVFFTTAGIKYEYEKEGFDLDGVWYLPDFWLPELNSFVEIKGEFPSCEEISKAFWLAWQSEKHVYIFCGSESLSGKESTIIKLGEVAFKMKAGDGSESIREGELSVLKKDICNRHSFSPLVKGFRCLDDVQVDIAQWMMTASDNTKDKLEVLLRGHQFALAECPLCQRIEIVYHGLWSDLSCNCHREYFTETKVKILKDGLDMMSLFDPSEDERQRGFAEGMRNIEKEAESTCCFNSPRLIKAYTAARQARFEYGR